MSEAFLALEGQFKNAENSIPISLNLVLKMSKKNIHKKCTMKNTLKKGFHKMVWNNCMLPFQILYEGLKQKNILKFGSSAK